MRNQSLAAMMYRMPDKDNTFLFLSDVNSILVSGEDTNGEFCLVHCTVKENGGPPLHIHGNEDETFYILEGELEFTYDKDTFLIRAGDYVYAPRGVAHTFKVKSPEARFLVSTYPAGFDAYVRELGVPYQEGMEVEGDFRSPESIQRRLEVARKYNITYPGID
jgi:quercetin dioxygenase-like cupin family protein